MKKLSVVVAGTGQIRDVEIQPGTTAGDVLHQLNLPDYLLSKGPNEPFFAAAESVDVQRAIAAVFIRSDYRLLPKPEMVQVLTQSRLRSRGGGDIIDILIRRLQTP